ncbi:MAG: hypothetical protein IJ587_07355 [Synergistaceae bacterium]|nr:hypothetical protein [Synergistaceae bacterium]
MLMGISDVLALAKTPEQREEMKQRILEGLLRFDDSYIDFSDIPEVTDFSRFRKAKPYFDKIREHNRKIRLERERLQKTESL